MGAKKPNYLGVRTRGGVLSWSVHGEGFCKDCEAKIYWCRTERNNNAPVDIEPDDKGLYVSHHATCSYAAQNRRRQKP